MSYDFSDVLKAVGPNASLVFAAWIFMTYLQGRYSSAFTVYRDLISSYRSGDLKDAQRTRAATQILLYRKRCRLMLRATNIGMVSAAFLIASLLVGAAEVMFPGAAAALKYLGTVCVVVGLLAVIASAALVVLENTAMYRALEMELGTIPDVEQNAGPSPVGWR